MELVQVLPLVNGARSLKAMGSLFEAGQEVIVDQHRLHGDLFFDGFKINPFAGHSVFHLLLGLF
jgi:hypothetical protein